MSEFGQWLRSQRGGMSQSALAEKAGLHTSQICVVERGKIPSRIFVKKVAIALGHPERLDELYKIAKCEPPTELEYTRQIFKGRASIFNLGHTYAATVKKKEVRSPDLIGLSNLILNELCSR